ncbi:MAG: hypothetical protein QM757_06790 [Paludibaculum sp.]
MARFGAFFDLQDSSELLQKSTLDRYEARVAHSDPGERNSVACTLTQAIETKEQGNSLRHRFTLELPYSNANRNRIVGEVVAKHGVLLAEDDPTFLLATIAAIALRDAQTDFLNEVRRALAYQEEAEERMQKSIGETIGYSVRRALIEGCLVIPRPVHPRWVVCFGALFWLLLFAVALPLGAMVK